MRFECYENISVSADKLEYRFVSQGPKGKIKKIVQFTSTGVTGIYSLILGNDIATKSIDTESINDNKDRNKIIGTVIDIIYKFISYYPGSAVYFEGNTPEKTRLYRIAINIHLEELRKDFNIYGILESRQGFISLPFEKRKNYSGFLIKIK